MIKTYFCNKHGVLSRKFCFTCGKVAKVIEVPRKVASPSAETKIIDMSLYLNK